jgi:hypothetical protein
VVPPINSSRRLTIAVLIAGAALSSPDPAVGQREAPLALVAAARAIGQELASIRRLDWKGPVDFQVSDRETIRRYATQSLEREMSLEDWAAQTALLSHCGLLPAGADLKDLVVRLYTEQVAGYYDPHRKTFYLADWLPQLLQRAVVAHEVTHALQDQHFDLAAWLGELGPTEDGALARVAVAEGDAMAAMLAYMLAPTGASIDRLPDPADLLAGNSSAIAQAYPAFDQAPEALQRLLLFPYVEGASFVIAALREGGWGSVDALYHDPPASTEQILHPDRYWKTRDQPRSPAPPRRADLGRELSEGSWGEFGTGLILAAALGDSAAATGATGWDGDRYVLYEKPSGEMAYGWTLVWDSANAAQRFATAYAQATTQRFRGSARMTTGASRFRFEAEQRTLEMTWDGDRVQILENY